MLDFSEKKRIQTCKEMILELEEEEKRFQNTLLINSHKALLKEEAKLIQELVGSHNTDIAFAIYHYLSINGWLSCDNHFEISAIPDEISSYPEISVCLGQGCCRHLAPHFANIMNCLKKSDTNSFQLVGTNYKTFRKKLPRVDEIAYNICEESFDSAASVQVQDYHYPNHIEVFSSFNQTLYDPLNFNVQRIDFSNHNPDNYNGPIDFALGMMFDSSKTAREKSALLDELLDKDISDLKRHEVSKLGLTVLRKLGIEICLDNISKIQEFKKNNESAYQDIKKQAKKYTHKYQINS